MFVLDSLDLFEPKVSHLMQDPQNAKTIKMVHFYPSKAELPTLLSYRDSVIATLFVPSWRRPISLDLQSTPDM